MKHLKTFLGRYLQKPEEYFIMDFEDYVNTENALAKLKSSITDLSDLIDEKNGRKYIRKKIDFEKRKNRVRQAGIASAHGSGFDNKFIGPTGFDSKFLG